MAASVPILVTGAMGETLLGVQNKIILSCINNMPRKLITLDLGFYMKGSPWHLK